MTGTWPPPGPPHGSMRLTTTRHRCTRCIATMGIRIMRLVTLWLVASAETFRVHGASAAMQGGKGVGREATTKGVSKKQQRAAAAAAKEVCNVGDSPATCRELTAKYRGGGEYCCRTTDFNLPSISVAHAVACCVHNLGLYPYTRLVYVCECGLLFSALDGYEALGRLSRTVQTERLLSSRRVMPLGSMHHCRPHCVP